MTDEADVVVVGGTPGGIAAAVRAARAGRSVCLLADGEHLGGMMASGLSYTDTLTMKQRAPILAEFVGAVREHYRTEYGPDSEQYEHCENGYVFEPHVAEEIFETLVGAEASLSVRRGVRPVSVTRSGATVDAVTADPVDGGDSTEVRGDAFVDASYEGDFAAAAGVDYRVGRESRREHDEQFAGRLFTQTRADRYYPREAVGDVDDSAPDDRRGPLDTPAEKRQGDLDLIPHPAGLTEIYPSSTGEGDDAVQAYNYRLCLSRDPENRRLPDRPPGYDRSEFLGAIEEITTSSGRYTDTGLRRFLTLRFLPNEKADMNTADLPGENHDYPEASPERREEIAERHRRHALGLLYFLQNDEAVPAAVRSAAREWGLARDEFEDNDNFPWQLYVREARRVEGRYTFTESDGRHAPGLGRAPVHADSVAIAEYPLDSHACTTETQRGSHMDGGFYASQVTRPAHVPYRTLLPNGVDNLLVPGPVSSTHVGYSMLRLEPTWMHLGEAAGFAAARAVAAGIPPADLDVPALQRALVESGVMVSFFNEFDMGTDEAWLPAVQLLGTRGFFPSYDARPSDALTRGVAEAWADLAGRLLAGDLGDPTERARGVSGPDGNEVTAGAFTDLLRAAAERHGADGGDPGAALERAGLDPAETLARGDACRMVYALLE